MRWPPFQHVIFDCDSTLTTVEGIDALAAAAGQEERIAALTRAAMDGEVELNDVYGRRLEVVRPTKGEIDAIRHIYKRHIVADAAAVITALQSLGHDVYIISGGLAEPVLEFGLYLGVPRENIRAVEVEYDVLADRWWEDRQEKGPRYLDYRPGDLTESEGKARIVDELLGDSTGRSLFIGDGISDLMAATAVDLFVGFGGVVSRERVLSEAPAFIHSPSLAPLLPLAAGPAGISRLGQSNHAGLRQKIDQLLYEGAITFQDERLSTKFHAAYQAFYSRSNGGTPRDS